MRRVYWFLFTWLGKFRRWKLPVISTKLKHHWHAELFPPTEPFSGFQRSVSGFSDLLGLVSRPEERR